MNGLLPGQVFTVGSSMGGYAALYYAMVLQLGGAVVCAPQTTRRALQAHQYRNWAQQARATGEQWRDLDMLVHAVDHTPAVYLEHGSYAADLLAAESLLGAAPKEARRACHPTAGWREHTVSSVLSREAIDAAIALFEAHAEMTVNYEAASSLGTPHPPPVGSKPMTRSLLHFIAGPCAIESRAFALETAEELKGIFDKANLPFVYKSSFDKANRSSASGFRGVGMDAGLSILDEVRRTLGVKVLTDVHEPWQAKPVAEVVDVLQTPAFLCRQTDFIAAVAATGKPVNIKKGQFLAPWEMKNVIDKARAAARDAGMPDDHFTACERGTSFGYGNLVVDMRGLQIMARPGAAWRLMPRIRCSCPAHRARRAAVSASTCRIWRVPPWPPARSRACFSKPTRTQTEAPCDGPNILPFTALPKLLLELKAIHSVVRET